MTREREALTRALGELDQEGIDRTTVGASVILVHTAAVALHGAGGTWSDCRDTAREWLNRHGASIAVLLDPDAHAILRNHLDRLSEFAADYLTSEPLAPPVAIVDTPHTPRTPLHVVLFEAWPHATHEAWPVMVDAIEASARHGMQGEVVAAHRSWLVDGRINRAIRPAPSFDRLIESPVDPTTPASVLFIAGGPDEQRLHAELPSLLPDGCTMVNPPEPAAIADDKWAMYELWRNAGVPTPETTLVSRGQTPDGGTDFPVVVKPRHGTEGRLVTVCTNPTEVAKAVRAIHEYDDAVIQPFHNSLRYDGNAAVIRLHVSTKPGETRTVESGYVHVAAGGMSIASAGRGGICRPVDEKKLQVISTEGPRSLASRELDVVLSVAIHAVNMLDLRLRIAGVDVVIDADTDGNVVPLVLDVNPRPAGLAHSRFLTPHEPGEPGVSVNMWFT
jgi:hypothetical protein